MIVLMLDWVIRIILNGNISFRFVNVKVELFFLNLFIRVIELNMVLLIWYWEKFISSYIRWNTYMCARCIWPLKRLFHNSQLWGIYFSTMYLRTIHIFGRVHCTMKLKTEYNTLYNYLMVWLMAKRTWWYLVEVLSSSLLSKDLSFSCS